MRIQMFLKIGGALLLTGIVAACGSGGSPASHTPTAAPSLESKFGSEFAAIFDAASTAQPTTVDSGSVPALAPADQPIAFASASSG